MKLFFKIALLVTVTAVWIGCEGDYRRKAVGGLGEAVVVMDSAHFDSETADAIRNTFGRYVRTLPTAEPFFNLRFREIQNNEQLEQLKRNKNLIIAAPVDDTTNVGRFIRALLSDEVEESVRNGESFAFPLEDRWYRDQWTLILTAPDDSSLAEQIHNSEKTLTNNLLEKEFSRWREEIYDRGEQVHLSDSLWSEHGWRIRVQHDWVKNVDTTFTENGETHHFLTMRRSLPNNDRWLWVWWQDNVTDITHIDDDWINARRDSLMEEFMRGTRDSSYITTEYRRPVETESFEMNGDIAYETLGTWQMTHDAMGGPFVNMTIYDEDTQRLFMLEFGQFAPKYNKLRFVRQFRTMLRTFESDSTWEAPGNQEMAGN